MIVSVSLRYELKKLLSLTRNFKFINRDNKRFIHKYSYLYNKTQNSENIKLITKKEHFDVLFFGTDEFALESLRKLESY